MTTTLASVSPPPLAEVRGRALGVTLLAFFALAWVGWGTGGHLPPIPQVIVVALVALLSIAVTTYGWRLARRTATAPTPAHDAVESTTNEGRNISRTFSLIVAAEWIGVFAIAGILGATGHATVIPALVCAGVGIHFIPLAHLFHVSAYYVTAGALLVIAIATFAIAPAASSDALWTLLPGIGAAAILYATCGVLLRQSNQFTRGGPAD